MLQVIQSSLEMNPDNMLIQLFNACDLSKQLTQGVPEATQAAHLSHTCLLHSVFRESTCSS